MSKRRRRPARPRTIDSTPTDLTHWHRLATSAIGSGGISGSTPSAVELLTAAAALVDLPPVESDDPVVLRTAARKYHLLTKQAIELENAAAELREAERAAGVVRRRIERAQRSAQRAMEREAQRAAGGLYAGESRSPSRPTHVDVYPSAWEAVRADAIRRRVAIGRAVGDLVTEAGDCDLTGHRDGHHARRFARLFLDDEDAWPQFRSRATAAGLTVARAVGVVVEIEAMRLGWRPEDGR